MACTNLSGTEMSRSNIQMAMTRGDGTGLNEDCKATTISLVADLLNDELNGELFVAACV